MATIPDDLQQFVADELNSGRYRSADELIAESLRQMRDSRTEWQRLRDEVQSRIARMEQGEVIELENDEALEAYFDEMAAEVDAELEAENGSAS